MLLGHTETAGGVLVRLRRAETAGRVLALRGRAGHGLLGIAVAAGGVLTGLRRGEATRRVLARLRRTGSLLRVAVAAGRGGLLLREAVAALLARGRALGRGGLGRLGGLLRRDAEVLGLRRCGSSRRPLRRDAGRPVGRADGWSGRGWW
ncbi:hypothetical protein KJK32_33035 [Streptomyces sp. JCM17656]|nr:hypothetical protein KJK32_33035 [Streptomyces sp. JCM17656]